MGLRVLVSGEVDLAHPPHTLEAVVALFLFRRLDGMIGRVPMLSGPFSAPEARRIPVKSLRAGTASFVLEGLPAFVRGGLRRLLSVLSLRWGSANAPPPADFEADS